MKYPVVIHKSKYGFDVYCPILPGCNSQGDTLEEALENIEDAITTYLEMVKKEPPRQFLSTWRLCRNTKAQGGSQD